MARPTITYALSALREAIISYGIDPDDYPIEVTFHPDVAAEVVDLAMGEATRDAGLVDDEDVTLTVLSVKATKPLATYEGVTLSTRVD